MTTTTNRASPLISPSLPDACPAGWSDCSALTDLPSFDGSPLDLWATPFVLLDDARHARQGTIFSRPVGTVVAHDSGEVDRALEEVRLATETGLFAAGYLAYDAGRAFERKLRSAGTSKSDRPKLWFGLFKHAYRVTDLRAVLPAPRPIKGLAPFISRSEYHDAFARVAAYIRNGDIYQANLSFQLKLALDAPPLAHFADWRDWQHAGWGAVISTGFQHLLSCSPELFFSLSGRAIQAKPMKGTAPRGATIAEDLRLSADLRTSVKDRAENLMIVDLLRNDLARISVPGSVKVSALCQVETYPTVFQLVSPLQSQLNEGLDAIDILRSTFPCGSITGAPKIRAMEIIDEIEGRARGAYTGAIGFVAPGGDATFNVAIRTAQIDVGATTGLFGVGSAVVADSEPFAEWAECLAKARFMQRSDAPPGQGDDWGLSL